MTSDAVTRYRAAEEQLTGTPGSPFEIDEELVLGERMPVFTNRLRSIAELLDLSAGHGDSEFLVFDPGPRLTFAEHRTAVASVAAALQSDHGIGPGDRVAVCGANSPGWVLLASATMSIGAVLVALNSWWTADELARAIELTEPALLAVDGKRRALLDGRVAHDTVDLVDLDGVLAELGGSADRRPAPVEIAEDDPALLLFTSGTSGTPKAAMLSHRALLGFVQLTAFIGARSLVAAGEAAPRPSGPAVRLAVFPLFHISGMGSLLGALAFGTKTVWPTGRFDAGRVIELTRTEGISMWTGASTHVVRLLDHPDLASFDPSQLVQVGIGGSATTPNLIARTEAAFPHLEGTFSSGYGLTESGGLISYASNAMLRGSADSVGLPLPTVEVMIVGDRGDELPPGEVGTITARSPILMLGYWRNPTADEALRPGRWLRTEDFGWMDDAGVLHMASRRRDLIIRGGENVYPLEIEDRLDHHPAVAEAAVIGVPDDELGQRVHAIVVTRSGVTVTADELTRHCAEALAYFKVPATIDVRTTPLPRSATGKVLKHLLESGDEAAATDDPG